LGITWQTQWSQLQDYKIEPFEINAAQVY
jgi:hypothetical protein